MVLPIDVRFCTNSSTNANLGPRFPVLVTFSVVNATKGLVFDVIKKQSQELKSQTEAQPHTNS